MAINWPVTPAVGATVEGPRGEVWKWDGVKWVSVVGAVEPAVVPPVQFSFFIAGKPPASQYYHVPIVFPVTISLDNFNATQVVVQANTGPASPAIFILSRVQPNGNNNEMGQVLISAWNSWTLTPNMANLSLWPQQFVPGGAVRLQAPDQQDSTLANIGFSVIAERV